MKIVLSTQSPLQLETECLIVGVLDNGDKQNPQPELQTSDRAIRQVAEDLIAAKEVTGKASETVLLHRPQGLKAKRLLFVGGGKAKHFAPPELRKLAGTAVRFLKGKNIKSFALLAPEKAAAKATGIIRTPARLRPEPWPRPSARSSRAPAWPTLIPTITAATARTRRCRSSRFC